MTSVFALDEVVLGFVKGGKVLDVGCGLGKWGNLIKVHSVVFSARRGHLTDVQEPEITGIDISLAYLRKARHVYDTVVKCHGAHLPYRKNSFDTVVASEIIEHIPRHEGFKLIAECERVARKVAIITTPPPRTVSLSPEHISSWKDSDFRKLGYKLYGVRCYPRLASKNILIQFLIAFIIGPLSYWFPKLSSDMVAVKFLSKQTDDSLILEAGR
jgi:ubiquinone/menaquinone biosynthesis C-methylase UbiE